METKPASQYRYFDRSFKAELLIFMFFIPVLTVLWVVNGYYFYYSGGRGAGPLLRAAVYFSVTFTFALIFYGNARAIAKGKSVVLDGDRIIKRNAGAVTAISCNDIKNIRLMGFPFAVRKWMVIESVSSQEPMRIRVFVRNGHKMVERIFGSLEERGLFIEGAGELKRRFYDAARRVNALQRLRDKHMPSLHKAITAAAVFSAATAVLFWQSGLIITTIAGLVSMILQVAAYFVAERFHVGKLLKRKEDKNAAGTDDSFASYYIIAGLLALFAGMLIGISITEPIY
jgi:hypothetical protein